MEAKILNFVRDKITKLKFFKELLNCSLCTGFWTGLLVGTFIPYYNNIFFALYSSATCYLIYLVNCILLNKIYPTEKDH